MERSESPVESKCLPARAARVRFQEKPFPEAQTQGHAEMSAERTAPS